MSTINPSVMAQYISPVYFMIILVLVGFVYHLIRNHEYKDTLLASVGMGLILGLVFNTSYDLLKTFSGDFIFILLVAMGGFLAVSLKKIVDGNILSNSNGLFHEFPENQLKSDGWWYGHNPRFQAIMIMMACLFCIILIIGAVSILSTVKEPVKISLETPISGEIKLDDVKNKEEAIFLTFNNTTEFVLKGSSETNATVEITVRELGIYNQIVPLDAYNNFTYKFSIPSNGSISKIMVEATKPGKETSTLVLSLKN